jgi:hypothetical protein
LVLGVVCLSKKRGDEWMAGAWFKLGGSARFKKRMNMYTARDSITDRETKEVVMPASEQEQCPRENGEARALSQTVETDD